MLKEEAITFPGNKIFFKEDGTNIRGGTVIAFKDNIKAISMQMQNGKSIGQT